MWFNILFGLVLIGFSVLMLFRNRTAWGAAQADEMADRERDFACRQYWRRVQANWMMAIVGLAVILGVWLPETLLALAYWLGVGLLVCWLALLAMADLVATRRYYGQLRQDQRAERAKLEAELDLIKNRDGNGRPRHEPLKELE